VRGAAATAAVLIVAALSGSAAGRDLATLWLRSPARLGAFLDGGATAPAAWLAVSQADLAGVADLPQTNIEAGYEGRLRCSLGWQRTGTSAGPWSEHRLDGRLGWRGRPVTLVWSHRSAATAGEAWPAAWEVALEPSFEPTPGLRLAAGIPLVSRKRTWARWGGPSRLSLAMTCPTADLVAAVVDGAVDRPAVRVQGWVRSGPTAALGLGWDASTGEAALLTALRRGGLMVRSRHAAHPLTGVTHVWQVAWTWSGRP